MVSYVSEFHQASVNSILQKRGRKARREKKGGQVEETDLHIKDLGERKKWRFFQEDGVKQIRHFKPTFVQENNDV